jgi:hypothetical protein
MIPEFLEFKIYYRKHSNIFKNPLGPSQPIVVNTKKSIKKIK